MPTRRAAGLAGCFLLSALVLGCGSSDPAQKGVSVSGTVRLDGQPLPQGLITFEVKGFPNAPATTGLDENGQYKLSGVPHGQAKVSVKTSMFAGAAAANAKFAMKGEKGGGGPAKPTLVPSKYESAETSGLTATVEDGKVFDFDLKSN